MFAKQFKKLMQQRKLTAPELQAILKERGVEVSLPTIYAWRQGLRTPKPFVQNFILKLLSLTS